MAFNASAERTSNFRGSGSFETFVSSKYRGDYKIPEMAYQSLGIRSSTLWPTAQQCLRIIPGYDAEGNILRQNPPGLTYTRDANPKDYTTDTICTVKTIARLGKRNNAVISSYRPGSEEASRWAGNTVFAEFASLVVRSVSAVAKGKTPKVKPGPDWSSWVNYNPVTKTAAILSSERDTMLMQALVWQLNGRVMTGADKQPLVDASGNSLPMLYLIGIDNTRTIQEMWNALIVPQDASRPVDGLTNSAYKGIAEQEGSVMWLIPKSATEGDKSYNMLIPHVSANMSSWQNTPYPLTDKQIHQWWHPWNDLLNFMTPDEQAILLAKEFGADTVCYVLQHSALLKDLRLPDEVAAGGVGKYAYIDGGSITLESVGAAPRFPTPAAPAVPSFAPPASPEPPAEHQQTIAQGPGGLGIPTPAPRPAAPAPSAPTSDKVFVSPAAANPNFSQALQGLRAATRNSQSELQKFAQDLAGNDDSSFDDDPFMGGGNGTV